MHRTRILFFTTNEEDYLSDGLLHGLRSLLGERVVDFPKQELVYANVPESLRARSHGRGFTLYGRLPDVEIDRYHVFRRAQVGEFELIVFSDIQRQLGYLLQLWAARSPVPIVFVDGSDSSDPFPYAKRHFRLFPPLVWPLCRSVPYFKRELDASSLRAFHFGLLERLPRNVHPIAFSIPESVIVSAPPNKTKDWPEHIVDSEVARQLGRSQERRYAFDDEAAYYADLQASRFGVTTKRAGWDCLRHYEIAAAGAVPCFRALDDKHPLCAPHGLDRSNTLIYRDAADLFAQVAALQPAQYDALQAAALAWVRRNTTVVRAQEFLTAVGLGA